MSTQIDYALKNQISDEIKKAAEYDGVTPEFIMDGLKKGTIVIPKNKNHNFSQIRAIGDGLHTKVNANIGSSPDFMDVQTEIDKLQIAEQFGADSVMDLSLGSQLNLIRKKIIEASSVMIGTVPIYQVGFDLSKAKRDITNMQIEDFLKVIEQQAKEGVDFMTIHAGVTLQSANQLFQQGRVLDVVSRGGSFLIAWMQHNKKENPLNEYFDDILDILYEYDVTVSLGDGLRPGATADATDRGQISELVELGRLAQRCREKKVQVMIEGPGHMPFNQIAENMRIEKKLCNNAPFYVLGPLTIDFAPGYDHIVSAIGGTMAAYNGANFLCYVTPAEHLKLPNVQEVKEGVIASKIAAFSADLAKGFTDVAERTNQMSLARKKLDWDTQIDLSLDPELSEKLRQEGNPNNTDYCSMCGEFCAIKKINDSMESSSEK